MYNLTLLLFIEQQQVGCFNQKNIFKTQQQKESQLLQYLLPKHILNKFLDDKINDIRVCDKLDQLKILFADLVGFTEYSSKVKPEEILVMLKNLFVEFDRKCCELKRLLCCNGIIDYNNRNPHQEAKNIVDLGFEMIKIITQVRKQINFDGLNMRIGIRTGSVFSGVMGTDIVRYDIYGPDVLIANKMESNGVKGYIHVSQETKAYLEQDYDDLFNFELHKTIDLKTIKRSIEGFLVHKLEQDHFPEEEDQFLLDTINLIIIIIIIIINQFIIINLIKIIIIKLIIEILDYFFFDYVYTSSINQFIINKLQYNDILFNIKITIRIYYYNIYIQQYLFNKQINSKLIFN